MGRSGFARSRRLVPHSHPRPGTSSRTPSPSPVLLTLRPREPGSRTTPARWGPGRALREGRAGSPRAAAAGWSRRRRWRRRRRRGVLLCSRSSPERGRDTPELGKWGGGKRWGEQRRRRGRRKQYGRPQRLRLLATLARRRLTPPPASSLADSEDERGTRS